MKRLITPIAATMIVLAACTSSSTHKPTGGTGTNGPNGTYPVTVRADNGQVTIAARPARIVSLSATTTQMLYAVGAGPQVVAVDKYSTDPPNAPRTPLDGTESAESYAPLHPDLLIVAFDTGGKLISQLSILHIPALLLGPAKTIDDTYEQIGQLGAATGHASAATKEVATIGHQLDSITRSVGGRAKGRTYYHEVDNTLYTATSRTFIGAMYARLGMVNIADAADKGGSGYPQLSAEYLVQQNPDYVFLADTVCCHESAATFAARPAFSTLKAVRDGRVVSVPDPVASQWGPRVVDFLKDIADGVTHAATTPARAG